MGHGVSTPALMRDLALGHIDVDSVMFNKSSKFEDNEFKRGPDVLGYPQMRTHVQWARASHVASHNGLFGGKDVAIADLRNGGGRTRWKVEEIGTHGNAFQAAVSLLCQRHDWLASLFSFYSRKVGVVVIRVFLRGRWQLIAVDDFIPCAFVRSTSPTSSHSHRFPSQKEDEEEETEINGELIPCFTYTASKAVWVLLLEKVLAKVYGSYAALHARSPSDILTDLTGSAVIDYSFPATKFALDFLHDPSTGYIAETSKPVEDDALGRVPRKVGETLRDAQYIRQSHELAQTGQLTGDMTTRQRDVRTLIQMRGTSKTVLSPEFHLLAPPQPLSRKRVHRKAPLRDRDGLFSGSKVDFERRADSSLRAWMQIHADRVNNREFVCLLRCGEGSSDATTATAHEGEREKFKVYVVLGVKVGLPSTELNGTGHVKEKGQKASIFLNLHEVKQPSIQGPSGNHPQRRRRASSFLHTSKSDIPDVIPLDDPRTKSIYGDTRSGIDVFKTKSRARQASIRGDNSRPLAAARGAQRSVFLEEGEHSKSPLGGAAVDEVNDANDGGDSDESVDSVYSLDGGELVFHRHHSSVDRLRSELQTQNHQHGRAGKTMEKKRTPKKKAVRWTEVKKLQRQHGCLTLTVLLGHNIHVGSLEMLGASEPEAVHTHACYVLPRLGGGPNSSPWRSKMLHGRWRGVDGTAGGSVLHATWGDNPMFRVVLERQDRRTWQVAVTLTQIPLAEENDLGENRYEGQRRQEEHHEDHEDHGKKDLKESESSSSVSPLLPIGLTVLRDCPSMLPKDRIAQSCYWAKRDVSVSFTIHSGIDSDSASAAYDTSDTFIVVPSTFEAFTSGDFVLSVTCTDPNAAGADASTAPHFLQAPVFSVEPLNGRAVSIAGGGPEGDGGGGGNHDDSGTSKNEPLPWARHGFLYKESVSGHWKPVKEELHARRVLRADASTLDNCFAIRLKREIDAQLPSEYGTSRDRPSEGPGLGPGVAARGEEEEEMLSVLSLGGMSMVSNDMSSVGASVAGPLPLDVGNVELGPGDGLSGGGIVMPSGLETGVSYNEKTRGSNDNHNDDDNDDDDDSFLRVDLSSIRNDRDTSDPSIRREDGEMTEVGAEIRTHAHTCHSPFSSCSEPQPSSHLPLRASAPAPTIVSRQVHLQCILTFASSREIVPSIHIDKQGRTPPVVTFAASGALMPLKYPCSRASGTYILSPKLAAQLLIPHSDDGGGGESMSVTPGVPLGMTSNTSGGTIGGHKGEGFVGTMAFDKGPRSARAVDLTMLDVQRPGDVAAGPSTAAASISGDPLLAAASTMVPLQVGDWAYGQSFGEVILCPMPWAPSERAQYKLTVLSNEPISMVPLMVEGKGRRCGRRGGRESQDDVRRRYASLLMARSMIESDRELK